MYTEKSRSDFDSEGLGDVVWHPDTLLLCRRAQSASYDGFYVLVGDCGMPRLRRINTWAPGRLSARRFEALASLTASDLGHSLVHNYGLQGELFEAFG
jgi:hypothetical protein